jgi:chromate transport protein ChrA
MILPGFVCVVVLTMAYGWFAHGPVLDYIDATLLPAAVGIVVVSAVRLGRPIFRWSLDLVFAAISCAAALIPDVSPAIVILAGGIAGALFLRGKEAPER